MPFTSSLDSSKQVNQEFIIKTVASATGGIPLFGTSTVDSLVYRTTTITDTNTELLTTIAWVQNHVTNKGYMTSASVATLSDTTITSVAEGDLLRYQSSKWVNVSKLLAVNMPSATNGQILIGNGTAMVLSTLTQGTNISITNGAGSITINATAPSNMVTTDTTQTITGTKTLSAITTISNATASSSTTTGALVVTGGVGIGGAVYVGSKVMTGDGTAALPAFSFISDVDTGIYRIGADQIGISTGGVVRLTVSTTATTISTATQINSTLGVTGITSITNSTASTATTNGALVVSGGVGIAGNLNVGGTLNLFSNVATFWNASLGNTERGYWSLLYSALGAGRMLHTDEEFAIGNNGVGVYNNSGGTPITITRITDASAPNTTGQVLRISHNGTTTSPGLGGFVQNITARRNAVIVQRFRAKIPVGFSVMNAENSMGTGANVFWITPRVGTGRWEEYIRVVSCGHTGSFSSGGHVYIEGTPASVFEWFLASCTAIEVNSVASSFANVTVGGTTAIATGLDTLTIVGSGSTSASLNASTKTLTISSTEDTLATVTGRGATTATAVSITNSTASSSTTTGALTVTGGVGIGGSIYGGALVNSTTGIGTLNTSSSSGSGLSLYGGASTGKPTYGMFFGGTGTFGTHGAISDSWATYFTMNNTTTRGWIFQRDTVNVVSISAAGHIVTSNTENATSVSSGAVRVAGGVGIAGDTWIGGTLNVFKTASTSGYELLNIGTNGLYNGNGDAATKTSYNMYMKGHNGMAFRTYDDTVTGVLDFRTGSFDMNGSYTGRNFTNNIDTGEKSYKFNTTANSVGFGMYGNSTTLGFYDWEKSHSYLSFDRTTRRAYFSDIDFSGNLYKNGVLFSGGGGGASSLGALSDVVLTIDLNYDHCLTYDASSSQWTNKEYVPVDGFKTIVGDMGYNGKQSYYNATASTATTNGALVITGGVGISGSACISKALTSDGTAALPSFAFISDVDTGIYRIGADQIGITTGGTARITVSTTVVTINSTLTVTGAATMSSTLGVAGIASITNSTASSATTNGALVVTGGVGIGGAVNINGITTVHNTTTSTSITTGALQSKGGLGVTGTAWIGGVVNLTAGGIATSTTTGTLRVTGGIGATGDMYIGGLVKVGANVTLANGGSNSLRVTTASGYVEIGPTNTGWAHYMTDRTAHWFDKRIAVGGGIYDTESSTTMTLRCNNTNAATLTTSLLNTTGGISTFGDLTIRKFGVSSTITFPAQQNDPGYIRHEENNNIAEMVFSVSDDNSGDYFRFGSTFNTWTQAFQIHTNGDVTAAGNITAYSDARLKTNVNRYENGLDKVMLLNPVTYTRKESGKFETGFIAQEVREIEPSLIVDTEQTIDGEENILSIDYSRMVAMLTAGIQEQQNMIKKQAEQIEELTKRIDSSIKKELFKLLFYFFKFFIRIHVSLKFEVIIYSVKITNNQAIFRIESMT
jgi:hypothetical protein